MKPTPEDQPCPCQFCWCDEDKPRHSMFWGLILGFSFGAVVVAAMVVAL